MRLPFYSIGHSTRSLEEFAALLTESGIARVVDIRKIPKSRTNPQFNADTLAAALSRFGVAYEHIAALGGLRGKGRRVPRDVNAVWKNDSFHNYADYALSREFRDGFARLLDIGRHERCAIMCAEAVWWRCHRRIVTDYLIAAGNTVFHVMGQNRVDEARLTPGAVIEPDGTVTYPAPASPRA